MRSLKIPFLKKYINVNRFVLKPSRFLQNSSGQATTEYILMLTIAVIISLLLTRGILEAVDRSILVFGGNLEKQLKTGRAPVNVYIN